MQTVTLSFFRFDSFEKRLWVIGQMSANALGMLHMPKAKFWKMFGSGTGQGFTPKPNWSTWAILSVWPDEETARKETVDSPIYARWHRIADESYTVLLSATSARGKWDMKEPFEPQKAEPDMRPIAALTRATVKFWKAERFWGREPAISNAIGKDANVKFKIGIGEIPFVQQVTFSVWPDSKTMDAFARAEGPHAKAVEAVRAEGWFKEELYARFRILGTVGKWDGKDPIGAGSSELKPAQAAPAAKPAPVAEAPKPAAAPAKPAYQPQGKPGKPGRRENA